MRINPSRTAKTEASGEARRDDGRNHRSKGWLGETWRTPAGVATLVTAIALVALGIAVIALPDDDQRILSLSPGHGPAASDLIGSALLMIGWGVLLARPILRWRDVRSRLRRGPRQTLIFFSGLGSGLLLASIFHQFPWWWAPGATLIAAAQLYLVRLSAARGD